MFHDACACPCEVARFRYLVTLFVCELFKWRPRGAAIRASHLFFATMGGLVADNVEYDDSRSNLWELVFPSMAHRVPGITGKLLWSRVFAKHYIKAKNARLRFFSADGKRLLFRARQNDRDEDNTRGTYKQTIEATGFNEEARSKVSCSNSSDSVRMYI